MLRRSCSWQGPRQAPRSGRQLLARFQQIPHLLPLLGEPGRTRARGQRRAGPSARRAGAGLGGAHFIPMRLRTFSFVEYAMTLEWCTGVSFCTIWPVSSLLFGCTVFDCATPPARGQRPLAPCRRGAHGGAGRRRTFTFTPSTTTLPYFGSTCSCGALSAPGRQRVLPRSGLQRACGLQGAAVCKGPATAAVRAPWSPRPPSPCPCPR